MRGIAKKFISRADLDQGSRVHDCNPVSNFRNYRQVVRNEKHGESELIAQAGQQIENLCLNGNVERGGRFIGDQQLRAVDDGHGNHHALPHSARKLVRIVAGPSLGIRNRNFAQGLDSPIPRFFL